MDFMGTPCGPTMEFEKLLGASANAYVHVQGTIVEVEELAWSSGETPMLRVKLADHAAQLLPLVIMGPQATDQFSPGDVIRGFFGKLQTALKAGANGSIWFYGVT